MNLIRELYKLGHLFFFYQKYMPFSDGERVQGRHRFCTLCAHIRDRLDAIRGADGARKHRPQIRTHFS